MLEQYDTLHKFKALCCMVGLLTAGFIPSSLLAANWADRINVTGFMSAKYQTINEANYLNGDVLSGIKQDGSLRGTMMGLNLNSNITKNVSMAAQFLGTQEDDNYSLHLDWGFIILGLSEELSLRSGKIKFPTGVVNEYVSVGNAYPWIAPPMLFYTEELAGPNTTREAYSGASMLWEHSSGDVNMNVDVFGGEIKVETRLVTGLTGVKAHIDWDEEINFQVSYYRGVMRNTTAAMEGRTHQNVALGMQVDMNNIVGYLEWAKTDMGVDKMDGTTWYTTWGYQVGEWLPHMTYQYFEKGLGTSSPQEQAISTIGLRYDISDSTDVKFEYSVIKTMQGKGLFENTPVSSSINQLGVAVDVVF